MAETSIYYSPSGNPEVWLTGEQPGGYLTEGGWRAAQPVPPAPPLTPVEAHARKVVEINNGCEAILRSLTTSYPDLELLTFDKQEAEARAYQADAASPTPILASIAAGRGMPLAELAAKVIAKADAFAAASGYLIGQRQNYEDQLDALGADATTEQIEAIAVVYRLPGAAEAAQGV